MTIVPDDAAEGVVSCFEGKWSINLLLDRLFEQSRDQTCISFIKSTEPFEWRHVSGAQLDQCSKAATAYYAQHIGVRRENETCKQIGLLAESGFDFIVAQMALIRLGYGVVLISPNNSVPAVVHLLKATGSVGLVVGPSKADAAKQAREMICEDADAPAQDLVITELFLAEEAIARNDLPPPSTEKDPFQAEVSYGQQANEPAFTIHSSGSTGFPKPYAFTHELYLSLLAGSFPYDAFCTAPLYHGFGCGMAWRQLMHRRRFYLYSAITRPDLVTEAVRQSTAEIIFAIPFTFKMLSENEESLEMLRSVKMCSFAGAPCPVEVGDKLVANGVNLMTAFGATEFGAIMDSLRDFDTDKGWNVMRPSQGAASFLRFENVGIDEEGPYEMVVLKGWKMLIKVNRPDGSYASGDLFRILKNKDDSVKGYVYVGRGDDTLTHLTGEKTNPVPMEQSIRSSPLIRDCLVFGAGQQSTGALLIPYEHAWEAHSCLDEAARQAALKKQLEPVLQDVNSHCPSHSRLVPEMIRFLSPDTRFPVVDKGSIKRAPANALFSKEIAQLYSEFDLGTSTSDQDKASIESKDQLESLLQSVLERLLNVSLDGKRDKDLTNLGVDSIMDSQIRSQIHRSVRMPSPLPNTVVFRNPTLDRLTDAVWKHIRQESRGVSAVDHSKQQELKTYQMLKDLRLKLQSRDSSLVEQSTFGHKEVVVLTGATGSLGAHILDQLRSKPSSIAKVICLNRAANEQEAKKRTEESLQARGLAPINEADLVEIVSLASDISKERLGLSRSVYDELASTVTTVIHNGWPVNFVMTHDSFLNVLEGSVNLMNLVGQSKGCLSPRFLFSSSVSVAFASREPVIPEEIFGTLENTMGLGYGHSKWIVENLCRDAETLIGGGFKSIVMRIGQMVGDRSGGIWNETEAPPLMIKGAQTIGCLPAEGDDLFWLPVDIAGLIVAELTTSARDEACVIVHIASEEGMAWKKALETLAEPQNLGNFEVVPFAQWVDRLAQSDQNPSRNPTIKLIDHYRSMQQGLESGNRKMPKFATDRLRQQLDASPKLTEILDGLAAYKPEYLSTTVAAWKHSGFLK